MKFTTALADASANRTGPLRVISYLIGKLAQWAINSD